MSNKAVIVLSLVLLISALLGSSVLTSGHFWGDDFAAYIMQAKSILSGNMDEFVAANTFTVTRSSHQIGPAAYPWGFPLMLVPVYAMIGLSPLALKLPGLLTFLAFLLVFFFLIRNRITLTESLPVPEWILAVLAVSLFAFNPELLRFLDNILSDIPFLFLSTLSIFLADLYIQEPRQKRRWILAAITGAAIFAAFFVRTQGLILLGSVLLYQGIQFLRQPRRFPSVAVDSLIIVAAFGVLWSISAIIFPGGQSSYLALYDGFSIDVLMDNIIAYSQVFEQFFAAIPGQTFFFYIFAVLFFIGLITRFKADLLFVVFILLYLIVLWTWPEWQGYRFIFPLLPFFVYFAFQGIRMTLEKVSKKQRTLLQKGFYAYLLLIIFFFTYHAGMNAYGNLRADREINGPFDLFSLEVFDFIKNETPLDSTVVFYKPRAMRLMTDRNALALTECERILEGDYLVLSKKVGENLQIPPEQIDECNLPLDKIFENRRFIVYRAMRGDS